MLANIKIIDLSSQYTNYSLKSNGINTPFENLLKIFPENFLVLTHYVGHRRFPVGRIKPAASSTAATRLAEFLVDRHLPTRNFVLAEEALHTHSIYQLPQLRVRDGQERGRSACRALVELARVALAKVLVALETDHSVHYRFQTDRTLKFFIWKWHLS